MSNPCIENSSDVATIFKSLKQASTLAFRNTCLLRRDKKLYKTSQLFNKVFNLQFVIVIAFIFYRLLHKQKYVLKQMNEMITYTLRFVMGWKNWLE